MKKKEYLKPFFMFTKLLIMDQLVLKKSYVGAAYKKLCRSKSYVGAAPSFLRHTLNKENKIENFL